MKKLSTISLFIFGVIVTAILVSGLVFYQNSKDKNSPQSSGSKVIGTVNKITASGKSIVLDISEISKHNQESDCWMLISGKVYDITSFFGSHPGGNNTMLATCGKDATDAYDTKDPYATNTSGGQSHSSRAKNMLVSYFLGNLNETINATPQTKTVSINTPNINNIKINTNAISKTLTPLTSVALNMTEISKHNKQSDCWMLINGKVYNVTSFFGSHPGGNSTMLATCGKDATDAYDTKDPYATTNTQGRSHSGNASAMLASYFIGNLNQTIEQKQIIQATSVVSPNTRNDDFEDD